MMAVAVVADFEAVETGNAYASSPAVKAGN
jgi:hypothetical protein